jgi:hypothetical protein
MFEDGMVEVHKTVYANSMQRERLEELAFVGPDAAVMRFHSESPSGRQAGNRSLETAQSHCSKRRC